MGLAKKIKEIRQKGQDVYAADAEKVSKFKRAQVEHRIRAMKLENARLRKEAAQADREARIYKERAALRKKIERGQKLRQEAQPKSSGGFLGGGQDFLTQFDYPGEGGKKKKGRGRKGYKDDPFGVSGIGGGLKW